MVNEPDLPISTQTYELIAEAGECLKLDPDKWERLKPTR